MNSVVNFVKILAEMPPISLVVITCIASMFFSYLIIKAFLSHLSGGKHE